MSFLERLHERARARPRRLVFPEGGDGRTLQAVQRIAAEGLAHPVLLARPGEHTVGPGVEVIDPSTDPRRERLAAHLVERRLPRKLSLEDALRRISDPLLFGSLLVSTGEVDGSVAGAVSTTANVLRAALRGVGTAPGTTTISSAFYMVVPPFGGAHEPTVLTFSDAAVIPDPTPAQMAEIALAAVDARRRVVGDEPRVAFLSFSTLGSAQGPQVNKVREALARFRELAPHVPADGELQADAALVESVGARKAPGSPVAGRANILIFPNLDAGNIGYKLVERLAGAQAIGPIVQGLARPCNDLSRGAGVEDIINVACITSLMAE